MNQDGLQYHIKMKQGDVGRYVLLPGDPGRVPVIASFFDEAWEVAHNREHRTFTGTLGGVTPVTRVDGRVLGTGSPGPMTDRIRALYEAAVYPA